MDNFFASVKYLTFTGYADKSWSVQTVKETISFQYIGYKLLLWMCCGCSLNVLFLARLFQVLGAKPEDEIVLKFWMTALNKQYRSHLLTCSGQSQAH